MDSEYICGLLTYAQRMRKRLCRYIIKLIILISVSIKLYLTVHMKKIFFLAIIFISVAYSTGAFAGELTCATDTQKTVKEPYAPLPTKPEEVAKHVGESVSVKAVLTGTHLVKGSDVLLLNVGPAYPQQDFTIVLKGAAIDKFRKTESDLKGKTVVVNGTVVLFKDKPQIEVTDVKLFQVLADK